MSLPEHPDFPATSLSKGWSLIRRFSEDVDLFINPDVPPSLGSNAVDRTLRQLRDAVGQIPGLTFVEPLPGQKRTKKGKERSDDFAYATMFPNDARVPPTVRLEAGIQSGKQPTEQRRIASLVAEFIVRQPGVSERLGKPPELEPFEMRLLAFRRTFVEKLFTIHSKIEGYKADGVHPERDTRHYADLYVLAGEREVVDMLASDEYESIRIDYDANSRRFYPASHRPPPDLRFRDSDALFPDDRLRAAIEPVYDRECGVLFDGPYPAFDDVLSRFLALRHLL